ncbi:MAG TPA: HEAT repeat domain-containing protein [Isosphaeraceae bacterium]|jgi:hypothetical protein|nr:HEAT repeat domain-containing protein [Isosphaeraceae bacterium]
MFLGRRFGQFAVLAAAVVAIAQARVVAQTPKAAQPGLDYKLSAVEQPSVMKGLSYLRSKTSAQVGESAMMALAMINADVPPSDPALATLLAKVRSRFMGSVYAPERTGGADMYEAGVVALVLAELDSVAHRSDLESVANYIVSKQNANGSWDYTGRGNGDTSISQYALLGLWVAEDAGATVPPSVWDQAAGWYMSVQSSGGSWNYHRDEGSMYPESLSMTAAGVGSLLLCQRQLARYRRNTDSPNPLLVPIAVEGQGSVEKYKPGHAAASIQEAANRGIAWLGRNFTTGTGTIVGRTPYYFLYAMERIGALSNSKDTLGGVKWYEQGRRFIETSQKSDGSWVGDYGNEVNTAYAILFVTRATARKIRKIEIKRLGAGTLLGGRGLPKDLASLTVAGGRVVVRPMNGAIEGMLTVLEDPRAENADAALAGLIDRYQSRGSAVLKPQKDRFRKLLLDPDPGVRRVAAWGLGRLGDLDVMPLLVAALKRQNEDDSVVGEVRTSLQFLSRKVDGFGPPAVSTPEERAEAAKKWLEWYNAIRPIDQDAQFADEGPALPPPPPAAVSSPSRASQ